MSLRVSISRPHDFRLFGAHVERRPDHVAPRPVYTLLAASSWLIALAIPKSMILGTGTPSCSVTRILEGLISRWMMPFWWACWTAWQIRTNNSKPLPGRQVVVVAVLRKGYSVDQLHHEVRPSRLGRTPRIKDPRNVRMIHHRQSLLLRRRSVRRLRGNPSPA